MPLGEITFTSIVRACSNQRKSSAGTGTVNSFEDSHKNQQLSYHTFIHSSSSPLIKFERANKRKQLLSITTHDILVLQKYTLLQTMSAQPHNNDDTLVIPDEFICPITQEVFQDPVMDSSGRSFERNAILMWLSDNGTCPMTREPRRAFNYIPNPTMKAKVRVWMRENGVDGDNDLVYKASESQQMVLTLKPKFNEMDSSTHTDLTSLSMSGHEEEDHPIPTESTQRRHSRNHGRRIFRIFRRSAVATGR